MVYVDNIEIKGNSQRQSDYPIFNSNSQMINSIFTKPRIPFKHSGTLFKKQKAIDLGGYDVQLTSKIDIDFFLKFLSKGANVKLLKRNLVYFYFHNDSISRKQRFKALPVWWKFIDEYSGKGFFYKLFYKIVRSFLEILKFVFEIFYRIRSRFFWIFNLY